MSLDLDFLVLMLLSLVRLFDFELELPSKAVLKAKVQKLAGIEFFEVKLKCLKIQASISDLLIAIHLGSSWNIRIAFIYRFKSKVNR